MKTVLLKCTIQFDIEEANDIKESVMQAVDVINLELQRTSLKSAPQILASSIDESDIEVSDCETQDGTEQE